MFDDFHSTVLEFMRESAAIGKLVKDAEGEYDPATGTVMGARVEIDVQAILMDLTLQSNGLSAKYNTLIEAGDKEAYVRPNREVPFTIDPSDRLRIGSVEYKIVTMKEINPNGAEPILYTLYLRR